MNTRLTCFRALLMMSALLLVGCSSSGKSPDNAQPVITITGENPQILAFGEAYVELGATASDNRDGDLTASIVIVATSVDPTTPGDYSATYTVTDAAGNAATVTRTVTVLPPVPDQTEVSVSGDIKKLVFNWEEVQYTEYYRLMENPDGHSGFTQVDENIPAGTLTATQDIAVHLFDWVEAQYLVEACNVTGCRTSDVVTATDAMLDTIGYFKASNAGFEDGFGGSIALNSDGSTLAVSAGDDSCATGMNGDQDDDSCVNAGAIYLFRKADAGWYQQAYIKASNTDPGDGFGGPVLSWDGNTLAARAVGEDSCATGVNGLQTDNTCTSSGAVYVFRFENDQWTEQAYIKASNADAGDWFGSIDLAPDGNTLVVGASGEDSAAVGLSGDESDNSLEDAGAVYLFRYSEGAWRQHDYIKASNTGYTKENNPPDPNYFVPFDRFGSSVAISANGELLTVAGRAGIYVFELDETGWHERTNHMFGPGGLGLEESLGDLSMDETGSRIAVSVMGWYDGRIYVHGYENGVLGPPATIVTPDLDGGDSFGAPLEFSAAGDLLAVGAVEWYWNGAGRVYLFRASEAGWEEPVSIRASNATYDSWFGSGIALSADGKTLAAGDTREDSQATGIGGDQTREDEYFDSGAVYVY